MEKNEKKKEEEEAWNKINTNISEFTQHLEMSFFILIFRVGHLEF